MKKIILDTNVILQHLTSSRLEFGDYIISLIKQKKVQLYKSQSTVSELRQALQYPQIKSRLNGQSAKFLAFLKYNSTLTDVTIEVQICRDPKDDKFLELAKQITADYIITGDKDLLILEEFETTRIISPRGFLDIE